MKFSNYLRPSGDYITVNLDHVIYLESLPSGRTKMHFVDGSTVVIELPLSNVMMDLE